MSLGWGISSIVGSLLSFFSLSLFFAVAFLSHLISNLDNCSSALEASETCIDKVRTDLSLSFPLPSTQDPAKVERNEKDSLHQFLPID